MAKQSTDRLGHIEQTFTKVREIEAALEPARDQLASEQDEVKEILGLHSATSIKLGGLRFSRGVLIGTGIGAAGMVGMWLFTPAIAAGLVVLAAVGGVLWVRGVFNG